MASVMAQNNQKSAEEKTLKEAFANDFLVGVAVSHSFIEQNDQKCLDLISQQFNAVSPEDVLKPETVHPAPDVWNFKKGDEYCQFAKKNGLKALGHTLMWHNQTPDFFWLNADGSVRTAEEMRATLVEYVTKTVTHFKGKVYAWDVVNEIIGEEGQYRNDKGWEKYYPGNLDDLVCLAFETAHRCDPDAELYYNDYNMWRQTKVDGVVRLVKMLQSKGIRIDGVGIQAHWGLNYPSTENIQKSIDRLHALGVKVMITELDVDMLPFSKEGQMTGKAMYDPALQREEFMRYLNPYPDSLPAEVDQEVADRYEEIMRTIYKNRDKIARVTFWGLHDGVSWKNGYPIPNRKNYPLIFDRNLQKKKAFYQILNIPTKPQGDVSVFKEKTVFKNDDIEFRQLDEHTWHGNGHLVYNESVYLIEGEKRALLIDAGTRIPGLKKIAEEIVKKPVTLIISHGHGDHIGAVNEWDSVWINAADEAILPQNVYQGVKQYLTDGQVFDLGGRQIEVVFTPGHTPGSTTFLDREAHYGFSSDAFGSGNLLVFTDLSTQWATCDRFARFLEQHDIQYLYPGHYWGNNLETPERVKNVGIICKGILDGILGPNTEGNNPRLPYIVDLFGVKVNYGDAQKR